MNCIEKTQQISELVDGALPAAESKDIRAHLKHCPGCRHEYNLLRLVADAVADLPQYEPGQEFNDRILLALGYQPVPRQMPAWLKWPIAVCAGIGGVWTGALVYALGSKLTFVSALTALQLAARPKEALAAFGMAAVKLGFAASDVLEYAFTLGSLALKGSNLPLQLGIASVIAFGVVALISRRPTTLTY